MDFERFKSVCREQLMQVEIALVKVYTTQIRDRGSYVAIDGGAHTGFHCSRIAKFDECRKVFAVEADPFTSLRLLQKLGELEDEYRLKIEVIQGALQENHNTEFTTWMSSSSHSGRSGISSIWQDDKTVDFRDEARKFSRQYR